MTQSRKKTAARQAVAADILVYLLNLFLFLMESKKPDK
jgi:hypothetical protein